MGSPGLTIDELAKLKRANAGLRRANAHFEGGSAFLRGGARPPVEEVIQFINEHKDRRSGTLGWGIEPIAKLCGIASSTYHAAKKWPPSARAVRDAELRTMIQRVYDENLVAYGGNKMWDHLNNVDGIRIARCTVEHLMRSWACLAWEGADRGSRPRSPTTAPNGPQTWSIGTSRPRPRTGSGWPISSATRRSEPCGGERTPLLVRRSGRGEAEGSLIRGTPGRVEAALTTTGRASTVSWCGSG